MTGYGEYEKATDLNSLDTHVGAITGWLRRHGPRTEIRAYCPRHHGDVTIRTVWPPKTTFRWRENRDLTLQTWSRWRREDRGGREWCNVCRRSVFMVSRGCREVKG